MKIEEKEIVTVPKVRTTRVYVCEICNKKYQTSTLAICCEKECKIKSCEHDYETGLEKFYHDEPYLKSLGECVSLEFAGMRCKKCGVFEWVDLPSDIRDEVLAFMLEKVNNFIKTEE